MKGATEHIGDLLLFATAAAGENIRDFLREAIGLSLQRCAWTTGALLPCSSLVTSYLESQEHMNLIHFPARSSPCHASSYVCAI